MKSDQEKVFLLSAYADIRGSGAYLQRITDENKQSLPFWSKFDELIDNFEVEHEYFVRHMGDGFICHLKLTGKNGASCVRFLNELLNFWKKAMMLIKNSKPRPDGVRIHFAAGDAVQKIQSNGELVFHGYHLDLIGTTIKIDVISHLPFVVHGSAKNLMSPWEIERAKFQFPALPPPEVKRELELIYSKDLNSMFEFKKQ